MVEIYYQMIIDLLGPISCRILQIGQDSHGLVKFDDADEKRLDSFYGVDNNWLSSIFDQGKYNRQMRSTDANEASSRSHLIFTIKIVQKPKNGRPIVGKLTLIDLAG